MRIWLQVASISFSLFWGLVSNVYGQESAKFKSSVAPLSLSLNVEGRFSKGYSWHLKARSTGQAHLSIESCPKPKSCHFKVSAAQFAVLRKAIIAERFFQLGKEYGDRVPDGSTRSITITQGKRSKTISLRFLREGDTKLSEVQRVLRVWHLIRSWFNDVEAVDLRLYDRRILRETN